MDWVKLLVKYLINLSEGGPSDLHTSCLCHISTHLKTDTSTLLIPHSLLALCPPRLKKKTEGQHFCCKANQSAEKMCQLTENVLAKNVTTELDVSEKFHQIYWFQPLKLLLGFGTKSNLKKSIYALMCIFCIYRMNEDSNCQINCS